MDKKIVLSYAISILLIIIILLFFDTSKVVSTVLSFNIVVFSLTVLLHIFTFSIRALTWKIIVDPVKKISFKESFHIISVSFFSNMVLPLRLGELIRAFLLSKIKNVQKSVALSTVIINRTIESLVLVGFFIFGSISFPFLPNEIKQLILAVGMVFLGLLMVFIFPEIFLRAGKKLQLEKLVPKKLRSSVKNLLSAGTSLKNKPKKFLAVSSLTILLWLMHLLIYFIVARGLGLNLGFPELLLIVSFSSLSAMIPSSPGFIGTFQAAFATIFVVLELNPELGLSMSILIHLGSYISTIFLGLFSANRLSISLIEVFSKAKEASKQE